MLIDASSSTYLRITLMDIREISRVCVFADFGDIAVDIIYKWKHANRARDYTRIDRNIVVSKLFKRYDIFCDDGRNPLKIIKCENCCK